MSTFQTHESCLPPHGRTYTHSTLKLEKGDVLAIENAEGFLQRFDLLLALRHAVFEALTAGAPRNACGLELLVVSERGIKLLLCALEVAFLLLQCLSLHLFFLGLVFYVLSLLRLVHRRIMHKGLELLRGLLFVGARLRLQACEVRLNHFEHTSDS